MLPVISVHPQEEPTIPVIINKQEHAFMVDTGATYSCIGKRDSNLPLSKSSVKTLGKNYQSNGKRYIVRTKSQHSMRTRWSPHQPPRFTRCHAADDASADTSPTENDDASVDTRPTKNVLVGPSGVLGTSDTPRINAAT